MAKKANKSVPQPEKRGSKLFLLIILVPIAIAVGGGTLLYLSSKNKAGSGVALPQIKSEDADPAIVRLVEQARAEVQKAPRSGKAWGRLGVVLAVHDFVNEAENCFAQAEKLEPAEVRWPYWHGLALGTNVEAALPHLERAAKICTNIAAVPLRYAEALIERGRLPEAEKEIQGVYAQNTNDARALLGLARIALAREQFGESLDYVTRSITVATNIGPAYSLLATVQQRMGNASATAKARAVAATLPQTPEWPDPFLREANTFRTGKAAAVAFAESLLQQGRTAEAVGLMKDTMRVYPNFVKGWVLLGEGLMETKDFAEAEKAFRNAARLAPEAMEVQAELAGALLAQAKYAEAETCYRAALRGIPDNAEAWFNLGLCMMNQKNNEGAIEAFRSATRVKPDFTYAYVRWGQALGRMQRKAEATEQLQHALQLSPENAEAKEMLEILQKAKTTK